jgi:hypothetical protein
MAHWSRNNQACRKTWSTLRVLDQNYKVFKESADVKMEELGFWNPLASSEMRKAQARSLAIQMDNIFRLIRKARYEEGVNQEKAVTDMSSVLTTSHKTISELAEIVDRRYLFRGEDDDE